MESSAVMHWKSIMFLNSVSKADTDFIQFLQKLFRGYTRNNWVESLDAFFETWRLPVGKMSPGPRYSKTWTAIQRVGITILSVGAYLNPIVRRCQKSWSFSCTIYTPHPRTPNLLSARQSQATRISKAQADAWFCRYVDFTDESSEDQNGNHVIDGELVIQNLRTPKLTKPVRVVESFAFSNIIFRWYIPHVWVKKLKPWTNKQATL